MDFRKAVNVFRRWYRYNVQHACRYIFQRYNNLDGLYLSFLVPYCLSDVFHHTYAKKINDYQLTRQRSVNAVPSQILQIVYSCFSVQQTVIHFNSWIEFPISTSLLYVWKSECMVVFVCCSSDLISLPFLFHFNFPVERHRHPNVPIFQPLNINPLPSN